MRFPLSLSATIAGYIIKNRLIGKKRFPMVLMLEPTHKCNLSCEGCGRIKEYKGTLNQHLPLFECLKAVDECDAQIVSICGGEPLLYPDIGPLVNELIKRKKQIFLCTNGILIKEGLNKFKPNIRLTLNFHIDGLAKTHDAITGSKGTFDKMVEGIKESKKRGFKVCTNTTIYKETDLKEIKELFKFLRGIGVDGLLVSPAYSYEVLAKDICLTRDEVISRFNSLDGTFSEFNFYNSPIYLDFLKGKRDIPCTPWGSPTRNPMGWKSPCYLLTDAHYKTFDELMKKTDWNKYGVGNDPRCSECMVHCGFEPTVAMGIGTSLKDNINMLRWNLS